MTIIFIVVISILAAVVGYLVSQLRLRSQVPEARDVPDRIDTDGLVTAVKEAVDAQELGPLKLLFKRTTN